MTGVEPEATLDNDTVDAFFLMADVVGYSLRGTQEQRRIVEHLSRAWTEHPLVQRLDRARDVLVNSTGDGFLAAIRTGTGRFGARNVLTVANDLIAAARSYKGYDEKTLQIRFGVHVGDVLFGVPAFFGQQMVGDGPNWCARIITSADQDQVAMSEAFFERLRAAEGDVAFEWVTPPGDQTFVVAVKHNREVRVRFLSWPGLETRPSARLQAVDRYRYLLSERLHSLARAAQDAMSAHVSKGNAAIARASLWESRGRFLVPTPFRRWSGNRTAGPSAVHYQLDPPEGPVAACVAVADVQVLVGLPDPEADEVGYVAALAEAGLRAETVSAFTRAARAFLAVPVGMDPGTAPIAALCIDFGVPLSAGEAQLREFGAALRPHMRELAALWTLYRG